MFLNFVIDWHLMSVLNWQHYRYLNDNIAQTCASYPKKFVGLATLPMQAPELAVQELRRCMEELGLKGIQIGSHINGKIMWWRQCKNCNFFNTIALRFWECQTGTWTLLSWNLFGM
jgi:predicted TIM-barrel fold metal-dependent hydrolase